MAACPTRRAPCRTGVMSNFLTRLVRCRALRQFGGKHAAWADAIAHMLLPRRPPRENGTQGIEMLLTPPYAWGKEAHHAETILRGSGTWHAHRACSWRCAGHGRRGTGAWLLCAGDGT